jgi:hypothetical protein
MEVDFKWHEQGLAFAACAVLAQQIVDDPLMGRVLVDQG